MSLRKGKGDYCHALELPQSWDYSAGQQKTTNVLVLEPDFWGKSDIGIVIRGAEYIEKHPCVFPMLFVFGHTVFLEICYIMPTKSVV